MFTIDFETHKIIKGSDITPVPVGLSVKIDDGPSVYYAFGHPTNNNSTYKEVKELLTIMYNSRLKGNKLLCHNSKFDLRICLEHFGLSLPDWSVINDTMIMAYLVDPREQSLALKDLAEKYCGIPPSAQSDLHEWIIAHYPHAKSEPGAYIAYAPGDLVGKYAESDTDMTYALYNYFSPMFDMEPGPDETQNIANAYRREMMLLPIVITMEKQGIDISPDVHDIRKKLEAKFELMDMQLSAYGDGEKPGSKAMFNVLRKKGLIDESKIQYTAKGNPRYGKEFLEGMIADKELLTCLSLRSKLQKFIGTYLKPFSESAKEYDGKFYPYYNQTRSEDDYGTRTGRFSSNIQQLPKDSGTNFTLYAEDDFTIAEMPSVRTLVVPSKPRYKIIRRDFSGQELRVTAHYAEGSILEGYIADPKMDVHDFVDNLIQEKTGHHLSRTPVKMINFLKLYGGGAKKLAERLKIPLNQAYQFFSAYDEALPEFKGLMADIEKLARSGKKIRTWGGRSYDVEPPKEGREFYYKLGNVLIQGSSADMTKEAMIRYFYSPERKGNLIMQVHDELIVEVHEDYADQEMNLLRWAMDEMPGWDVPLRSDGKIGNNLGEMEKYEDD